MKLVSVLLIFSVSSVCYGSPCSDLTGTWRNQLNSNMTIESITGNSFTGVYHTAVESTAGAARLSSKITGMIQPVENGKLIGFNVLWNRGMSLTAWVGQCIVCEGKEKLYTTWVLRSYMPATKQWMTTRANQDTFWRPEDANEGVAQNSQPRVRESSVSENVVTDPGMQGEWKSPTGDSFNVLDVQENGVWTGTHLKDGENGALTIGRFDGNQTYTGVGFISATSNKVRGYTGHINDPQAAQKMLETSWLEHTFHDSCINPRKYLAYGMEPYTHNH